MRTESVSGRMSWNSWRDSDQQVRAARSCHYLGSLISSSHALVEFLEARLVLADLDGVPSPLVLMGSQAEKDPGCIGDVAIARF